MEFTVDPELAKGLEGFTTEEQGPATAALRRQEIAAFYTPMPDREGADVTEVMITPAGPRALVYRPTGATGVLPTVLHSHGGGYMFGSPEQTHFRNSDLCAQLGVALVSVDYRKAPEHPYPAALDDMRAAWGWIQGAGGAAHGLDPARVALLGESAGGGLAAAMGLWLRYQGGVQPVLQCLIYPMIDDRTASPARPWTGPQHHVWTAASNVNAWTAYLGHAPGGADVAPLAAPARATDLSGLPPTWIGTGDIDLFAPENLTYAAGLIGAGVPCEMLVVPGAYHAFQRQAPRARITRQFESSYLQALSLALTA